MIPNHKQVKSEKWTRLVRRGSCGPCANYEQAKLRRLPIPFVSGQEMMSPFWRPWVLSGAGWGAGREGEKEEKK